MIIFKILKEQQKIYDFIGEKIVWNTHKNNDKIHEKLNA